MYKTHKSQLLFIYKKIIKKKRTFSFIKEREKNEFASLFRSFSLLFSVSGVELSSLSISSLPNYLFFYFHNSYYQIKLINQALEIRIWEG